MTNNRRYLLYVILGFAVSLIIASIIMHHIDESSLVYNVQLVMFYMYFPGIYLSLSFSGFHDSGSVNIYVGVIIQNMILLYILNLLFRKKS